MNRPTRPEREIASERKAAFVLTGLVLVVILAQGILLLDTFYGDPNIYLCYARNIARGDPFSFNPGEFSSGATGPLWAAALAAAFVFPDPVLAAKLIGLAFTLLAFGLTVEACRKLGATPLAAVVAAAVVSWRGAFYGQMLYESSLLQCLLALLLWWTADALAGGSTARGSRRTFALAVVWAALPLVRPDAVIPVVVALAVLAHASRGDRRFPVRLGAAALLAAIPGLTYFAYSCAHTGYPSVSAAGRGVTLLGAASSWAGIRFSLDVLRHLLASPLVVVAGFALWAWEMRHSGRSSAAALRFCGAVVLAYVLVLTFVVPATGSQGRYLLPALPFLAAMAAVGLSDLATEAFAGRRRVLAAGVVTVLTIAPAFGMLRFARSEAARGWDFDVVMERGVAELLNRTASDGAWVLTHEVQLRYLLRDDLHVLSIDGITDGKVVPFVADADLRGFLLRYRPDYWVANDTVRSRAYLAAGILRRAVDAAGREEGASVEIDGIRFTNLARSDEQRIPAFAGWRQLFALTYPGERGADD